MCIVKTHTHTHTHTHGRTRLNEWSACCRGRYLRRTHQTQQTNIMPAAGFETAVSAIRRLQLYALGRMATGFFPISYRPSLFFFQTINISPIQICVLSVLGPLCYSTTLLLTDIWSTVPFVQSHVDPSCFKSRLHE
jgi:hypothetical protein